MENKLLNDCESIQKNCNACKQQQDTIKNIIEKLILLDKLTKQQAI